MNKEFLNLLRCPVTGQQLSLESHNINGGGADWLVSKDGSRKYPIKNGIPRFVAESNYADNFGMQWNHFAKTQLDSHSGHAISADRFWAATGWSVIEMKDRWVLDVGCGSGRFAEVALSSGANVVALDYSSAVDACRANLGAHPRLHVVQGDIYALPFAPNSFDYLYSLGVLQHTPDVSKAFSALPPVLVSGGRIAVDYYEKTWRSWLLPKYWLRPFTKSMDKERLFVLLQHITPTLLNASRMIGKLPFLGDFLKKMVPVANYEGILPLDNQQLKEWALLDTFDWLSPVYDNPQTSETALRWLEDANISEAEVVVAGHLVARGVKP